MLAEGSMQLKSRRKRELRSDDCARKADLRLNAVLRLNVETRS